MNSRNINLWFKLRVAALLLSAFSGGTCIADDNNDVSVDTNAYQLLQLLNQNEALSTEIARLRGRIEEMIERSERARESQIKIATDFDTRIAGLEARPSNDTSEDKARIAELESRIQQLEDAIAAMHEVVASAAKAPVALSPSETIYESALEKYQAGNFGAAILDFQAFLQLYGNDPLSANARYWLAEALLHQGAYDNAIENGEILLHAHPDSQKAPDTMFLLGKARLELGDAAGARSAWENLVFTYPDSSSANKARDLLERLP